MDFIVLDVVVPRPTLLRSGKYFSVSTVRYHASLTANTIFHRSHTPLRKWFWAIYLVGTDKRGCSAALLERFLEVHYQTAWLMIHKIRAAFQDRDAQYMLDNVIEMDDAFFGGSAAGKRGVERIIKPQ